MRRIRDDSGDALPRHFWRKIRALAILSLLYWILLVSLFAGAIWLRFSLPLEPIADPDTWGYLSPAMGVLLGTGWEHHLRNYLYPSFLLVLLQSFHDFRAVSIAQHLFGVAAGALFLLVWRRLRGFSTTSLVPLAAHRLAGLCGVAVYLYAQPPISFEMHLRPEGIISFLVMLNLLLAMEFSYRCWLRPKRELSVSLGVAVVASAVILSLAKPSFVIAALGSIVPVAVAICGSFPLAKRVTLVITPIAMTLLLLVPEQFAARRDLDSATFLPTELFFIHASLIHDQMRTDLHSEDPLPYSRDWLADVEARLERELVRAAAGRISPTLGFNPDYLMFDQTSFDAQMRLEFKGDRRQLAEFYRFYYLRSWRKQPTRMLGKIWQQMLIFYSPVSPAYRLSKQWPIGDEYSRSLAAFAQARASKIWKNYPPLIVLIDRTAELAASGLVVRVPKEIRQPQAVLAQTYLWCFFATAGMAVVVFVSRRTRRRFGPLTGAVLFFFWYNFGNCIVIAVVHTLNNWRYDRTQLIFTILAQLGALLLCAELVLAFARDVSNKLRAG